MESQKVKNEILQMVKGLVNFPFPQICVHAVSLDLLQLLINNNIDIPEELIRSVCQNSNGDVEATEIINDLIKNT
jgi:hypothetical protein